MRSVTVELAIYFNIQIVLYNNILFLQLRLRMNTAQRTLMQNLSPMMKLTNVVTKEIISEPAGSRMIMRKCLNLSNVMVCVPPQVENNYNVKLNA